jgi:hypothetical protein
VPDYIYTDSELNACWVLIRNRSGKLLTSLVVDWYPWGLIIHWGALDGLLHVAGLIL